MKKTEKKEDGAKALLVVRMRGAWGARWKTKRTLEHIHLNRRYHATLVRADAVTRGMLQEASNSLAWGPADAKVVEQVLAKRAELAGGKRLTPELLAKASKFKTLGEFAQALSQGSARLADVSGLKPLFRLHPPRGGLESVKRSGPKGSLGNRGPAINELVQRML